jgi:hypothetical protein
MDRGAMPSIPAERAPLLTQDPVPCHDEEGRVSDEVVEIIEPAAGITDRPPVQLRLQP